MAWLTREDPRSYSRSPKDPDMETLSYWLARIEPLIRAESEDEIIVVFANRSGTEEEAVYAGTSAVLGIHAGEVKVYGILGRGEKELLIVDTSKRPQAKLISEPNSIASEVRPATATDKSDHRMKTATTASPSLVPNKGPQSLGGVLTPLSPVDPISPHAYFASKSSRETEGGPGEPLKSSTDQVEFPNQANSPALRRPQSPKSRNASRTREAEKNRPPLASDDLAVEDNMPPESIGVKSTPYYTAMAPSATIYPEDAITLSRPKSSVW